MNDTPIIGRVAGGVAMAFGALTLLSGTLALSGSTDMGAVVGFVLWFNTLAGLFYVLAGIGLWRFRQWSVPLSYAILAATLLVFAAFGLHVVQGGAYETRTVFAMGLRSAVWVGISLAARQAFSGR